jgi:hypothetical protein
MTMQPIAMDDTTTETTVLTGSEAELDRAIAKIEKARDGATGALWRIGREIAAIIHKQLWKSRKAENQSGTKYDTFREFCEEELKFTMRHAERLAVTATKFSEQEFIQLGSKKTSMLIAGATGFEESPADAMTKLPEEDRAKVMAAAANASLAEIEAEMKRAKGEQAKTGASPTPFKAAINPTEAPAAPAPQQVTLALVVDKVVKISLLSRTKGRNAEDVNPATIADLKAGKTITARHEVNKRTAIWFTLRESTAGHLEILMKPIPTSREGK